jgi:hypothetical protein
MLLQNDQTLINYRIHAIHTQDGSMLFASRRLMLGSQAPSETLEDVRPFSSCPSTILDSKIIPTILGKVSPFEESEKNIFLVMSTVDANWNVNCKWSCAVDCSTNSLFKYIMSELLYFTLLANRKL